MNVVDKMKLAAVEGASAYRWGAWAGRAVVVLTLAGGVALAAVFLLFCLGLVLRAWSWAMGAL